MAPPQATGTITGPNEPGPYAFGDTVTFTTTIDGTHGREYPMVYVEARSVVDDAVLYGELNTPGSVFTLGGGSSPWFGQRDDANCRGVLLSYGGPKGSYEIAEVTFEASGS